MLEGHLVMIHRVESPITGAVNQRTKARVLRHVRGNDDCVQKITQKSFAFRSMAACRDDADRNSFFTRVALQKGRESREHRMKYGNPFASTELSYPPHQW